MSSLCVGLNTSYESLHLIQTAINSVQEAFGSVCTTCIIQTKTQRVKELEDGIKFQGNLIVRQIDNHVPTFLAVQDLIIKYLECDETHLLKIDADTLVCKWSQEWYDLEGHSITYNSKKQTERYKHMPNNWKTHSLRLTKQNGAQPFDKQSTITGIQGGYLMMSRKVAETIRPLFFEEPTTWNDTNWAGEEQIFGFYLKIARILTQTRQAFPLRLNLNNQRFRMTQMDKILPGPQAYHPIKNKIQARAAARFTKRFQRTPLVEYYKDIDPLPTIAVYITIAKETFEQVDRACAFLRANLPTLQAIYLIDNGHANPKIFKRINKVVILPQEGDYTKPTIPTFYRFQIAIRHFLKSDCEYFIKCDADTIVLRPPEFNSPMAGEGIVYHKAHHHARFPHMPKQWQELNRRLWQKENLHSIHGGFIGLRRDVAEAIEPLFYNHQGEWDPNVVRDGGNKREHHDAALMIGEEHSLGWWLKQKHIEIYNSEVENRKHHYVTYRATVKDIRKPELLKVFHPVKTQADLIDLMKTQPVSYSMPAKQRFKILLIHPTAERFTEQDLSRPNARARGGSQCLLYYGQYLRKILNQRVLVDYWFANEETPSIKYDIAIAWNSSKVLQEIDATVKGVYPHHHLVQPFGQEVTNYNDIDFIIASSLFHQVHLQEHPALQDKYCELVPLGIRKDLACRVPKHKKNYIVYHSAPNRGLDNALAVWERLYQRLPEYEFHIFGGLQLYEPTSGYRNRPKIRQLCSELKSDPEKRIVVHGFTPHEELFKYLAESKIWLYPSSYPETFCCALHEALAHHVVPICCDTAIFSEVVNPHQGIALPVDLKDKQKLDENLDAFAEAVITATKDQTFKNLRKGARRKKVLSWEESTQLFLEALYRIVDKYRNRFT